MPLSKQTPDASYLDYGKCMYLPTVNVSPDPAHYYTPTTVYCQYLAINVNENCLNPIWGQGWDFNADNGFNWKVPPIGGPIGPGPLDQTKGLHTGFLGQIQAGQLENATQLTCDYRVGCHGDDLILTASTTVSVTE